MKNLAVFFDRDNTINYDPGYINKVDDVRLMPGVAEGLAKLKKELDCKLIVISNQSGVVRGYLTEETVREINRKINLLLIEANSVEIDDFFYCIYHPDFNDDEKSKCRKPSPQMVIEAAEKYNIDLNRSFFIGDAVTDIECGKNAGTKTILLVYDEHNSKLLELEKKKIAPDFVAKNFYAACEYITEELKGQNN